MAASNAGRTYLRVDQGGVAGQDLADDVGEGDVEAVHDAVAPVDVLLADGGASANPVLMQLQADTSGRQVHRALAGDLSPLWAAHLAGRTAGVWDQADLRNLVRPRRTFEPQSGQAARDSAGESWHFALARARRQT